MVSAQVRRDVKRLRSMLDKLEVPIKRIILFGSHARNLAQPSSDIDVCIVCDSRKITNEKIAKELQASINFDAGLAGLNMDIIVTTTAAFRDNKLSPILHEIRAYGIEI